MLASAAASTVRLPKVMRDYACQRTLVCCRPPWRVWLTGTERERIEAQVGRGGLSEDAARRLRDWVDELGPAHRLVAQRAGACVMLDEVEPACVLHRLAGPSAQPRTCQSFPRSVVVTPFGIEAAFLLACPTAASLVVDRGGPFEWTTCDVAEWPYAPALALGTRVRWTLDVAASFDALEELRGAWWAALEAAALSEAPGEDLLAVLGGMQRHPEDPAATGQPLVTGCDGRLSDGLGAALCRLPHHGAVYVAALEALKDAWRDPTPSGDLVEMAGEQPAALGCAAGLLLQHAGVHDARPALEAITAAAEQLLRALQVQVAVRRTTEVSPREAAVDALTATSHLSRLEESGAAVLL